MKIERDKTNPFWQLASQEKSERRAIKLSLAKNLKERDKLVEKILMNIVQLEDLNDLIAQKEHFLSFFRSPHDKK